uniref:Uncharacterized protein n=1 Tax=Mycena chlorophos TaxID=658473 RepID=A0ABQ0LEW7_MYCCL|nr:predicted protein [Mycena chlorophos]
MKATVEPKTPVRSRRQSLINVFKTPTKTSGGKLPTSSSKHQRTPYERPRDRIAAVFRGTDTKNTLNTSPRQSNRPPTPIPGHDTNATKDLESDDEFMDEGHSHTLSAMGDISMSVPYYMPGATGGDILLGSPVSSLRIKNLDTEDTGLFARPRRPAPPARRPTLGDSSMRVSGWHASRPDTPCSVASEETVRPTNTQRPETPASISSDITVRPTASVAMRTANRLKFATRSTMASFGSLSSIGTIPDEEEQPRSTRQSRFAAFMKSRDLTHSPDSKAKMQAKAYGSQREKLEALAREASDTIAHQIFGAAGAVSRPLRGNAPLPARPPIPRWGSSTMAMDD